MHIQPTWLYRIVQCCHLQTDEAYLMVMEKVHAMFEAGASLMAGGTASSVVDRYREHVAANAKRLSH